MSIEALPNELLVKIFSHFRWKTLRDRLSLVNRRWYQVIGMAELTNKATLQLSKSVRHRQQESRHYEDICIPLEVLCDSSREYVNFSCSMHSMDFRMMSGAFGTVLDYCHQRWHMNGLRIKSHYGQFILLLQHHRHVLNDVVKADITVKEAPPEEGCFEADAPLDTNFVFPMEKLQKLKLEYGPWSIDFQSPPCFLSLLTPNLESLNIRRCVMRRNVHLTFYGCTKLRSVMIFSRKPLGSSWSVPDPVELNSILPQASDELTRLKLINCPVATTFRAMFGNLRTIILAYVTLVPTDDPLECSNLTKLVLHSTTLRKPLKLRIPQLHTLICDSEVLKALHLEDALQADRLVIDWSFPRSTQYDATALANPVGLSSFRRLHLKPWQCRGNDDDAVICWLWPHLGGISELKLQGEFKEVHFNRLRQLWEHFPRITSLRLQGMTVPGSLNFVPACVQNISIKDCSTEGSGIEFPPGVKCVQVLKLWKQTEDAGDGAGMSLLPPNRYSPLESKILRVRQNGEALSRTVYSTRDCHVLDDD